MSKLDPHKTYRLRPWQFMACAGPGTWSLFFGVLITLTLLGLGIGLGVSILWQIAVTFAIAGIIPTIIWTLTYLDGDLEFNKRKANAYRLSRPLKRNQLTAYVAVPDGEAIEFHQLNRDQGWARIARYHAETEADEAHEHWSRLEPSFLDAPKDLNTPEAKALANALNR